jgi:hypothetical protein
MNGEPLGLLFVALLIPLIRIGYISGALSAGDRVGKEVAALLVHKL